MKKTSFLIAASVLAACATPTPIETAQGAARSSLPDAPTLYQAAQENVGPVQAGWIDRLRDPILSALVREAQENNRDLQAAAASVDSSRALANQAGASLSPQVGLAGSGVATGDTDGNSADSYSASVQASWELDIWGRLGATNQASVLSAEAAEADYVFSQYSIAAAVARSYFLAIDADNQVAISKANVDGLKEIVRISEVQYEFGMASRQDVSLAKSDLATAEAGLAAAKGGRRDALRSLEVLLGRYPGGNADIGDALPELPQPPPAGLPSDLLERRPDIIAAERRVAAAFNSLDAAKAAKYPSFTLTGEFGGSSADLLSLLDPANLAWTAAASIAAPLVDGGRLDAQVAEATADQKSAIASYGQTVIDAFQEVETGLDQLGVLRKQTSSTSDAAKEANTALAIARIRYDEGETDLLDVLSIQQRVFAAEADLSALQRSELENWVNLNLALGGSWDQS